jgi:rSAM/selenodomain-associated transferase 1
MKEIILYFVKYPEAGKVKTRLAKSVGRERAAELYRHLAEDNLSKIGPLKDEGKAVWILFDPPEAEGLFRAWLGHDHEFRPQAAGGLGERLWSAFQEAFEKGAARVIAVGSDTIGLDAAILREASARLAEVEIVLGPALDGGYYLIGSSRPRESLFKEIPWSTNAVLDRTLAVIRRENLSYGLLAGREDLDRAENLKSFFTNEPNSLS